MTVSLSVSLSVCLSVCLGVPGCHGRGFGLRAGTLVLWWLGLLSQKEVESIVRMVSGELRNHRRLLELLLERFAPGFRSSRCPEVMELPVLQYASWPSGKWVVSLEKLSSIKPFVFDAVLGHVAFPVDSILCRVQGGVNSVCKDDRTCDCSVVWFL